MRAASSCTTFLADIMPNSFLVCFHIIKLIFPGKPRRLFRPAGFVRAAENAEGQS